MPEFASELAGMLLAELRHDLGAQLDNLRVVDRCRCGDDFCSTFYARPKPAGAWGPGLRDDPAES